MNWYLAHFFRAWLVTIFVETLIILGVAPKITGKIQDRTSLVAASMFASSLTLPYVWFVFPFLLSDNWSLLLSELFAWLTEAVFYKLYLKLSFKDALLISLIANGGSYGVGYFLGKVWH